jgi:hypothetical protein
MGQSHVVVRGESSIVENVVHYGGGGVYVGDRASLQMVGSLVEGNYAKRSGGGLQFVGDALGVTSNATRVTNNTAAYGKGGGVLATDSSLLVLAEGVSVAYNAAAMDFGGGVALTGDASMVVGCTCKSCLNFVNNTVLSVNTPSDIHIDKESASGCWRHVRRLMRRIWMWHCPNARDLDRHLTLSPWQAVVFARCIACLCGHC